METQCTCCCFVWSSKRRGKAKEHAKASSKPIAKRISKEHLLGYVSSYDESSGSRNGRQGAKSPLNQYSPPLKDGGNGSVGNELVNGMENGRKQTFDELRTSMRRAYQGLPLVLPLLRAGVRETAHVFRSQGVDGNKMINEYVWKDKIGTGSYGKVVLYQSQKDEKLYAIKIFRKSRLCKLRVSPTETAMMDVLREVAIMKRLDHPNIVKLYEIIDDPQSDNMYLVLEYVEHKRIFEGCGPPGGIGEALARKYFRDAAAGLLYLHCHNIIHGDIKPENLLLSGDGSIKICDFGVSRLFEGENDELRRSPGTPVYTAPECCSGLYYRGRPADAWALGCTLYCMVFGRYPFVGDGTFSSIYDEIVNQPLFIPEGTNPDLADLLRGLLCKDVRNRMPLTAVPAHPWLSCSFGQVQANSYETMYALQHPFPAVQLPRGDEGIQEQRGKSQRQPEGSRHLRYVLQTCNQQTLWRVFILLISLLCAHKCIWQPLSPTSQQDESVVFFKLYSSNNGLLHHLNFSQNLENDGVTTMSSRRRFAQIHDSCPQFRVLRGFSHTRWNQEYYVMLAEGKSRKIFHFPLDTGSQPPLLACKWPTIDEHSPGVMYSHNLQRVVYGLFS